MVTLRYIIGNKMVIPVLRPVSSLLWVGGCDLKLRDYTVFQLDSTVFQLDSTVFQLDSTVFQLDSTVFQGKVNKNTTIAEFNFVTAPVHTANTRHEAMSYYILYMQVTRHDYEAK